MTSLESIGTSLADKQSKNPALFIILALIVLGITVPGIFLLLGNIEPSLEKILPQEVEEVKLMNDMRAQFGADMMMIMLKTQGPAHDIYEADVIKYTDVLANKLRTNEFILEVNTIADLVKQSNNNIIPESTSEIKEILRLNPRTPMFVNYDRDMTVILIRSDTGATSSTITQTVNDIHSTVASLEEMNPGVSYSIAGFNAIDKATFEVIIKDFANIISKVKIRFAIFFLGVVSPF